MHASARWLPILLAVLVLVLLSVRSGQDEPPAPLAEDDGVEEVRIPLPEPEPVKTLMERARGFYSARFEDRTITVILEEDSRFRMIAALEGKPAREATGTWSLVGTRLTMAYHHVPGSPEITPERPEVVVNEWRGRAIVLRGAGLPTPVVLTKRSALRELPR